MQDGQSRSMFHPDRSEDDDVDLEIVVESESETEARTASLGAQRQLKGESDSSIKCFMANWTSDSDASGGHGAESEPPARKAEGKRPQKDAGAAGTSKAPKKKTGAASKRPAPAWPSGPVLKVVPLQINKPTFSMASFAAHLPRAAGYFLASGLVLTLPRLLCLFALRAVGLPDLSIPLLLEWSQPLLRLCHPLLPTP
jgi:hypothetical protein